MATEKLGRDGEAGATYLLKREARLTFPPGCTALLVIDPVNDFLSEGGAAWDMTETTVKLHDVVSHLKDAIEGAREHGVPVLFAPMAYTEEDYANEELQRRSGINRLMFERKMFLAGSWGADFHPELRPHPEETVLMPHKGIDVWQTDLPEHLQRLGTTHLVIAGMTANLCCESTGRHAMEEGYDVTFLSNAIGADNVAAYEAAIHLSYPLIANAVLEVEEFLEAINASTDAHIQVQPGDTVFGSDHGEIGTVDEVVQESEQTPGYLLIAQGLIFKHNTFIPLDAVVKRAGTKVFVNVPRIILQNMPWDQPPSHAERQAKQGPRAANVQELYGSRSPSIHEQSTQSEHGVDTPS